jgi:enoyl-CoA hydratase/carnithine racemase
MQFLTPAALAAAGAPELDVLLLRRGAVIATAGEGELRGHGAALALFGDFLLVHPGTVLVLDTPAAWAGALWRAGRRALRLYVTGERFAAREAIGAGLADAIGDDPERWLAGRSPLALDSAAELLRHRGGDALERTEFARLFALGEPQLGLEAFLARRPPRFGDYESRR